jgi:hypothetical protein
MGKWVDGKTYVHKYSPKGEAVEIKFSKKDDKLTDHLDGSENNNKKRWDKDYYKRGRNDRRLLEMHKIASESPNKWQILETKANFINGIGPVFFDEAEKDLAGFYVQKTTPDTKLFLKRLKLKELCTASSWQLSFADEYNWRVVLDEKTRKIKKVTLIDNNDIRAAELNDGNNSVKNYYLSTDFGYKSKVLIQDCKIVPAYDPENPLKYGDFIIHCHLAKPGQKFYGFASWWGTKKWSDVTNKVPDYYEALFKNGFFVTHQIVVPDDYFYKPEQTEDEEIEAKAKWVKEVTDTLSSVEESNKIVVTFKKMTADGKDYMKGVEILPVANPINDEAFVKMLAAGNRIQSSGHGLPGILTAIELGDSQGTSGKEVTALSNYVQDFLMIIYRNALAAGFDILKDIEGIEPTLSVGIGRIPSYTFDSTPKADNSNPNI